MRAKDRKRMERVAYHEAGHAVASVLLGVGLRSVTIVPDAGRGTLGLCQGTPPGRGFRPDAAVDGRTMRRLQDQVMVLLAGGIAEYEFTRRHNHRGCDHDYRVAADLAGYACGGGKELEFFLGWLGERVRGLLRNRAHWPAVEALAAALMERRTIGGADARRVIHEAIRRTVHAGQQNA